MKKLRNICFMVACTLIGAATAAASENNVWDVLSANCGKAFVGKIVKDTEPSDTWSNARIVMHVRDCSESEIKVPLHVDDNRSRIWIVSKLPEGKMRLKHDHRHKGGSSDDVPCTGAPAPPVWTGRQQSPSRWTRKASHRLKRMAWKPLSATRGT